ncbi:MAG: hypothetical protein ACE5DQ_01910 [Candidatus Paceibacterota bacterium]
MREKRKRIKKKRAIKKFKAQEPALLFTLPIVLTFIGLFFIFEASSIVAFRSLGDSFHFLRLQAIWFVLGIGTMIFFPVLITKNSITSRFQLYLQRLLSWYLYFFRALERPWLALVDG